MSRFTSTLIAIGMLSPVAVSQETKTLNLTDLIEKAEPACVRIDVKLKNGGASIGSGFVVDTVRKWVVTNYHVVADANAATVQFADGTKAKVQGWRAHYTNRDLALVQIETNKKLTALPIANDLPRKGAKTVAIGAPQGLSFTVTEGIVSAIREGKELHQFSEYGDSKDPELEKFLFAGTWLQTSTPISPGSSGGPLLNMKGEVVGVNSGSLASGQNINFAVSCKEIQLLVRIARGIRLRELAILTPSPNAKKMSAGNSRSETGKLTIMVPSSRRFRHRFKIEKEEDEFDQITVLRTPWLALKHDNQNLTSLGLRVNIVFGKDEVMPLALWEVGVTARTFQFLRRGSSRFQVLGGEKSYELLSVKAEQDVKRGGTSEIVKGVTGLDDFVAIVLTEEIKARLGDTKMDFDTRQIECLRDLASQIPTGTFFGGKLQIEQMKPEDDPTSGRKR